MSDFSRGGGQAKSVGVGSWGLGIQGDLGLGDPTCCYYRKANMHR